LFTKKEKGKAGKADILALKGFKEYKLHISITPHLKAKELYFLEKKNIHNVNFADSAQS